MALRSRVPSMKLCHSRTHAPETVFTLMHCERHQGDGSTLVNLVQRARAVHERARARSRRNLRERVLKSFHTLISYLNIHFMHYHGVLRTAWFFCIRVHVSRPKSGLGLPSREVALSHTSAHVHQIQHNRGRFQFPSCAVAGIQLNLRVRFTGVTAKPGRCAARCT